MSHKLNADQRYYRKNKPSVLARQKKRYQRVKEVRHDQHRAYNADIKLAVLTHYGPNGKLQCAWPDCSVTDVDMLSLDHINNDGATERNQSRGGGGQPLYRKLYLHGFLNGYQTLCHNHQWKKELMRRREGVNPK